MKLFIYFYLVLTILYSSLFNTSQAEFANYLTNIKNYFFPVQALNNDLQNEYNQRVPYEVSIEDEKFITEASTLTGVALSKLDSCQQRVVLKLQVDCHKMNDEQLAKMAVHLLNCQSYTEGRKMYPCTDDMSIKECTTNMDSDTWTSYHLMSNRARAVCFSIRQVQFRGLAEHTVNRLMEATQNQLFTLNKIQRNQEDLKDIAETTIDALNEGHQTLAKQQKDLQEAQFFGQLTLEDNIKKLSDEKQLILDTHNQLVQMTQTVKKKLEDSTKQMENQADESRLNHKELINDLIAIQEKTHNIFRKIEESSDLLIKQNNEFKVQYESTLKNLAEVNRTVHTLVSLVGGTRQVLEERLSWITTALGGTDLAVERLYLIIWHLVFMLLSMLTCAFLSAHITTRLIVSILPPMNLSLALYGNQQHFQPFALLITITSFILVQRMIYYALSIHKNGFEAIQWPKEKLINLSETKSAQTITNYTNTTSTPIKTDSLINELNNYKSTEAEMLDEIDDFNPTPPLSRIGHYRSRSRSTTPLQLNRSYKGTCQAQTRKGTPCKLFSLPGRCYCYRHQSGDSVMG